MTATSGNWLTPFWEYPACSKCAHCDEPIEFTWSSSAVGQKPIHGRCWAEYNTLKERP